MADEWERASRPSQHAVTTDNLRRVVAEFHKKFLGEELQTMSARSYCEYWLKARSNEISQDTKWFYGRAITLFLEHLGPRADLDLFKITKADIVTFRDSERDRVTAKTTNHELKVLRMIFRQAQADGWTVENPAEGVKIVKEIRSEKSPKRPFTFDELRQVLSYCGTAGLDEWKAMVVRGYYTGQRLLDVASMVAGQEDPHLGQVSFWTGKTGQRVIIEMHPAYVDFVLSLPAPDDPSKPLHPYAHASVNKKERGRSATISGQFARILGEAGLRPRRTNKKKENGPGRTGKRTMEGLTFHSLRHSLVSHLQELGVSRSIVQDIVGHESEQINAVYTKLDRKTKRDAMAKLPDITR